MQICNNLDLHAAKNVNEVALLHGIVYAFLASQLYSDRLYLQDIQIVFIVFTITYNNIHGHACLILYSRGKQASMQVKLNQQILPTVCLLFKEMG